MEYCKAREIAMGIVKKLDVFCSFCSVAGSIRREKPEVKDIELVVVARTFDVKDLFGEVTGSARVSCFVNTVETLGKVLKGDVKTGRYVQIELLEGINLDLFIPIESDCARQFAIRTGSSEYSHKVLAVAWRKKGYVGTENGLRLEIECFPKDLGNGKTKWVCTSKNPTLPPVWENEYDFFKFLNLEWIDPKLRV